MPRGIRPTAPAGPERVRTSARQRRALEAICDTFVPEADGLPSATRVGVPEALLEAVAANPRASERRQVAALLTAWDSALATGLSVGTYVGWSSASITLPDVAVRWLNGGFFATSTVGLT